MGRILYKNIFVLWAVFCSLNSLLYAQKTTIYTHENATYNSALELFDKEKFGAAQKKFSAYIQSLDNAHSEAAVNATFYEALCGLELFNGDAEELLIEFIRKYPESPKAKLAYYHLGRYKFRKRRYKDVIGWFQKIDPFELDKEALAEYHFKMGYSYFRENMLVDASKAFFEIKDTDNKYTAPARYYYGHITYVQRKYESSLQAFLSLKENKKFAPIVPYYITQIYYLQKKYDELMAYAPGLLEKATAKRSAEIARLLGESYYRTQKYEEAIPYLKKYNDERRFEANVSDKYQLGYAYYKIMDYEKAIHWFKKTSVKKDSIGQASLYHMADCYIRLDKKRDARNALYQAYKLDFDQQIKEDALFSFAKLSYELSLHPYNDAIKAFEEFINTYPNSTKLNDAYEFLVTVYFTTKNYKAAIQSLENIKVLDLKLKEAYQKITHYRGLELFNNRNYDKAIAHFNKSDKHPVNSNTQLENTYWKGEANYRLKKYDEAIKAYKKFIFNPRALTSQKLHKTYYDLGYSYFQLQEYENANNWFRKYYQNALTENTKIKNDVLNRIGDCFFIQKNYHAAIEYYDKVATVSNYQSDYALYQSAFANGILGNHDEKIDLLNTLIAGKEKSRLLDDAIFELGKTKLIQNKNEAALVHFNAIISDHPNSRYVREALVKKGLIHYNSDQDELALASFKKVVKEYPKTEASKEALHTIKKIYLGKGDLPAYETYLTTVDEADASTMVLDADYYEVAENSYMGGDCKKALSDLANYLEKYPTGAYVTNAYYYKANCELKTKLPQKALASFKQILEKPKNKFTENALLKTAEIHQQLDDKESALASYAQLEYLADMQTNIFKAQVEQMRLNYVLEKYDAAQKYCQAIINKDVEDANLIAETHLIYGKSALKQDDYNLALKEFGAASGMTNKFGVEAKYNIAHIYYLREQYDECETAIFGLIKNSPSYGYWIGKALLLLADNYMAIEDVFQAKATLKSVIERSKFPELVFSANEKLAAIETMEINEQNKQKESEDTIDLRLFDESSLEKLFDEELMEEEEIPSELNEIEENGTKE